MCKEWHVSRKLELLHFSVGHAVINLVRPGANFRCQQGFSFSHRIQKSKIVLKLFDRVFESGE